MYSWRCKFLQRRRCKKYFHLLQPTLAYSNNGVVVLNSEVVGLALVSEFTWTGHITSAFDFFVWTVVLAHKAWLTETIHMPNCIDANVANRGDKFVASSCRIRTKRLG
jgi:hypothetical protein